MHKVGCSPHTETLFGTKRYDGYLSVPRVVIPTGAVHSIAKRRNPVSRVDMSASRARCFDFAFGCAQHDKKPLFPSKLPQFFVRANELHGAVVEQNAAALRVVVVEREHPRPTVLIPAGYGLEQKNHVRRRIRIAVRIHGVVVLTLTRTGTNVWFWIQPACSKACTNRIGT